LLTELVTYKLFLLNEGFEKPLKSSEISSRVYKGKAKMDNIRQFCKALKCLKMVFFMQIIFSVLIHSLKTPMTNSRLDISKYPLLFNGIIEHAKYNSA
jgi:hypothetical protein